MSLKKLNDAAAVAKQAKRFRDYFDENSISVKTQSNVVFDVAQNEHHIEEFDKQAGNAHNDVIIEEQINQDVNKTRDDNVLDCEDTLATIFDEKDFETKLKANINIDDIILLNTRRLKLLHSLKRKKYKRQSLSIVNDEQSVKVDSKIRMFSFHEDQRPAYVGTVSKVSKTVSGRKPFAKEESQINYDCDSEEEWREENEEGEDVCDSDNEDIPARAEAYNDCSNLVSEDDYSVLIVDVDGLCFPSFKSNRYALDEIDE